MIRPKATPRVSTGLLVGLLATAGACGSIETEVLPDADTTPVYTGAWKFEAGEPWNNSPQKPIFIEFRADGTGDYYTRDDFGILGCGVELLHTPLSDTLLTDSENGLLRYELTGDDELVLTDASGRTLTWSRVPEVPTEAHCGAFETAAVFTGLDKKLNSFTNIASPSEGVAWFAAADGLIYTFDTDAGTVGSALAGGSGSYNQLLTVENGDYWAHCGCGGSQDIKRYSAAGVEQEELDTITLGEEINNRGAAWDGTALWLQGYSYDTSSHRLLEVTGSAGSRVINRSFGTTNTLRAIAADDDGALWALSFANSTTVVSRLDTSGDPLVAVETYTLPRDANWKGLAFQGETLLLLGYDDQDYAVIAKLVVTE